MKHLPSDLTNLLHPPVESADCKQPDPSPVSFVGSGRSSVAKPTPLFTRAPAGRHSPRQGDGSAGAGFAGGVTGAPGTGSTTVGSRSSGNPPWLTGCLTVVSAWLVEPSGVSFTGARGRAGVGAGTGAGAA